MNRIVQSIAVLCIIFTARFSYAEPADSQNDYTRLKLPDGAIGRLGKGGMSSGERFVAFSSDSRILAVSTNIGVWLYDTETENELALLSCHSAAHNFNSVSFSSDGELLASGDQDGAVHLWSVSTFQEVGTLRASRPYPEHVQLLSFSADGRILAAGEALGTVNLWSVPDRREIATFNRREIATYKSNSASTISLSPDGETLAYDMYKSQENVTIDGFVGLYSVSGHNNTQSFEVHSGSVDSISFSPDGKLLATGGGNLTSTVKLWSIPNGENIATLSGHTRSIQSISFSPNGKMLASGSYDETARLWSIPDAQEVCMFDHGEPIESVSLSPDGEMLASGGIDENVKIWSVPRRQEIATLKHPLILSVSISPDGEILASGSWGGAIELWSLPHCHKITTLEGHEKPVRSVSFSSDGKMLASGSDKGMKLWSVPDGRELAAFGSDLSARSVFFHNDKTLVSNNLREVNLWSVPNGEKITTLAGYNDTIHSVSASPDGNILAIGVLRMLKLWSVPDGLNMAEIKHSGSVDCSSFSSDGELLAMGEEDLVRIWSIPELQEITVLKRDTDSVEYIPSFPLPAGYKHPVRSISFSPVGELLAIGYKDGITKLWSVPKLQEIATLRIYSSSFPPVAFSQFMGVTHISFSPDGNMLACGYENRTVKLWSVPDGQEIAVFEGHTGYISSLSFSPNGELLVSRSRDFTVLLWDLRRFANTSRH